LTLMIARHFAPRFFAYFIASNVSIVSPDCDTAITSVFSSMTGSEYMNSEAICTSMCM